MKSLVKYLVGIYLFCVYDFSHCLRMRVIPGIPTLTRYNKQHIEDIKLKTRRNGRGGEYAFTIDFTNKQTWTNNVSFHFIFYEFLHNEYRPSFVELHYKYCDLVQKDAIIGTVIRKTGLGCPLPAGEQKLRNMTYNQEFPSVFPFEKGKVELIGNLEPSGKEFVRGDLVVQFKMIK